MSRADLLAMLEQDEGLRLQAYDDATGAPLKPGDTLRGHPTIGIGRALDVNGITTEEARYLLENEVGKAEAELDRDIPWWRALSENRRHVLVAGAIGEASARTGEPRLQHGLAEAIRLREVPGGAEAERLARRCHGDAR